MLLRASLSVGVSLHLSCTVPPDRHIYPDIPEQRDDRQRSGRCPRERDVPTLERGATAHVRFDEGSDEQGPARVGWSSDNESRSEEGVASWAESSRASGGALGYRARASAESHYLHVSPSESSISIRFVFVEWACVDGQG